MRALYAVDVQNPAICNRASKETRRTEAEARVTNMPQKQKFTTVASCSGRVMAALQAELQSTPMRIEIGRKVMGTAEKRREFRFGEKGCSCAARRRGDSNYAERIELKNMRLGGVVVRGGQGATAEPFL
jgi:hypothetical protein